MSFSHNIPNVLNFVRDIYIHDLNNFCTNQSCEIGERSKTYGQTISIPETMQLDNVDLKLCCFKNLVLADLNDDTKWKNDKYGIFHYRQSNEQIQFVLIDLITNAETILNNNNLGEFADFNTIQGNENLSYFILDWKKVLQNLGQNQYKIVKRFGLGSISQDIFVNGFNLKHYSVELADKTVRIDVKLHGYYEKLKTDFKNANFETNFRVPGFFGNKEPKLEEDYLIDRNYVKNQISIKATNEYKFQSNYVPECVTKELWEFILLADDIKITDYNLNNHTFAYKLYPVKFENNEGTEYSNKNRKAILNLTFSDKTENIIKRNY